MQEDIEIIAGSTGVLADQTGFVSLEEKRDVSAGEEVHFSPLEWRFERWNLRCRTRRECRYRLLELPWPGQRPDSLR